MSSIAGELITDSLKYDGGRKITVYIPPAQAEAIVFAGDGHLGLAMGQLPRGS